MGRYDVLLENAKIPKFFRLRQTFPSEDIGDVANETRRAMIASGCLERVRDRSVAVAVGSRGINKLPEIVHTVVDLLKERGANVFIVPAMGSQGGALAENQAAMLNHLGVTPELMGVPFRSTMDTVVIGKTEKGEPVYFDRFAAQADYTVSIVRIKPHTSFRGPYESGIVKMNVIGLGNQKGADACHRLGMHVMGESLKRFGKVSIEKSNLLFSVAVIENAYDKTCRIRAIPKDLVLREEPELLSFAQSFLPRLPIEEIDLLVVDEMGKNIAGTGMDSNIIQRFTSAHMAARPGAKCIAVLDLTDETCGAASGMGLADFATRRFFEKIDFFRTYPNAITSRTPMAVRMPLIMENDYDAIRAGILAAYDVDYERPRIIRIKNTLRMDDMLISEALLPDVRQLKNVFVDAQPIELSFDNEGNLTDLRGQVR